MHWLNLLAGRHTENMPLWNNPNRMKKRSLSLSHSLSHSLSLSLSLSATTNLEFEIKDRCTERSDWVRKRAEQTNPVAGKSECSVARGAIVTQRLLRKATQRDNCAGQSNARSALDQPMGAEEWVTWPARRAIKGWESKEEGETGVSVNCY